MSAPKIDSVPLNCPCCGADLFLNISAAAITSDRESLNTWLSESPATALPLPEHIEAVSTQQITLKVSHGHG